MKNISAHQYKLSTGTHFLGQYQ